MNCPPINWSFLPMYICVFVSVSGPRAGHTGKPRRLTSIKNLFSHIQSVVYEKFQLCWYCGFAAVVDREADRQADRKTDRSY